MRREWIEAERRHAVRAAAEAWRESGLIDEPARRAIADLYPDDRERLGIAWRILLGGFTLLAAGAAYGFLILAFSSPTLAGLLAILFGLGLTAATEALKGPLRRSQGGIEEATAIAAAGFLIGGAAWLLHDALPLSGETATPRLLLVVGALGAAAAARWGPSLFAALAMLSLFLLGARLPAGAALARFRSRRRAPRLHRRAAVERPGAAGAGGDRGRARHAGPRGPRSGARACHSAPRRRRVRRRRRERHLLIP